MNLVDARGASLSAGDVEERVLAGRTAWAWIDDGGGWLERDVTVGFASPGTAPALGVVDEGGIAVLAGPRDARRRVASAVEVVRRGRRVRLDRAPFVHALASGSARLFRACVRCEGALGSFESVREPPTAADVEDAQARLFGSADMVAAEAMTEAELWSVERTIVERWLRPGDRVLAVGCGAGREAIALAKIGMLVHGVDVSAPAIDAARARAAALGLDIVFTRGSLARLGVPSASFDAVLLASDIFAGTPGRAARIRALREARAAVRPEGVVAFQAELAIGRMRGIRLEAPRVALRALGVNVAERGGQSTWRGAPPERVFRHLFRNDVELIDEVEEAGLAWEARLGSHAVARRSERAASSEPLPSIAREVARVIRALPLVEHHRRTLGPEPAVTDLRRRGARTTRRDPAARAQLRSAIALCDRLLPLGGGCFRRALLEVALDAGAAEERFHVALHDKRNGHVWLDTNAPAETPPIAITL